ncbi:hypothetical protein ACWGNZ_01070 [Sphingomonas zeae]
MTTRQTPDAVREAVESRAHEMLIELVGPDQITDTALRVASDWLKQEARLAALDSRAVDAVMLNPTPLEKLADGMAGDDPVSVMAIRLMRAWAKVDPRSGVAQYPVSYVATFSDMARSIIAATPAPAVDAQEEGRPCETCQGNGEVVTDWDRYMHGKPGDTGDEGTKDCSDCDGTGRVDDAPAVDAVPAGEVAEEAHAAVRDGDYRMGYLRMCEAYGKLAALSTRAGQ